MDSALETHPFLHPFEAPPGPEDPIRAERADDDPDPEWEDDFEEDDSDSDDEEDDLDDDWDDDDWDDDEEETEDPDEDSGEDEVEDSDSEWDDEPELESRFRTALGEEKSERTKRPPRPTKSNPAGRKVPTGHSRLRGGVRSDAPLRHDTNDDDD